MVEYTVKIMQEIDENQLYVSVCDYLIDVEKLEAQVVDTAQGLVLQAREVNVLKKFTGMGVALTMKLQSNNDLLIIEFGETKWLDKAAAGAAGWFLFAPLIVTGVIGAYRQSKLPIKIMNYIENYVRGTGNIELKKADESVLCPGCKKVISAEARFCSSCGMKLVEKCGMCGAEIEAGARFCNSCGGKLYAE